MANKHFEDIGSGFYRVDGKLYSIRKAQQNSLLHDWTCPHCGKSQLSYKDEETEKYHRETCKALKRKKKAAAKKKLSKKQTETLKDLGIIK